MEFNDIDPIGREEDFRPRKPFRNHRLRRGIYILPSIFTVANLLCGYYAILATLEACWKWHVGLLGRDVIVERYDGAAHGGIRASSCQNARCAIPRDNPRSQRSETERDFFA